MEDQIFEEIEMKSKNTIEKMEKIGSTKQYIEAIEKIKEWLNILENEPERSEEINKERGKYMQDLENTYPQIYSAIKINDKKISEKIYQIRTGEKIVID